jgi:hypothetical protein
MRCTSRSANREAPISEVSHSWGANSWSEPSLSGSAPSSSPSTAGAGAEPAATWKTGCDMRTITVCGTRAKWSWSSR